MIFNFCRHSCTPVTPAQAGVHVFKGLDSRFRGNDEEVRGNDEEVRGNDEEVRGNDEEVRGNDDKTQKQLTQYF